MQNLKKIFNFYIYASFHIAVAVFALVQITKINLHLKTDFYIEIFIFFGTVLGYNILKNFDALKNKTFDFNQNSLLVLINFVAFLIMLFCFLQIKTLIQIEFIKIGFLVLCYPFLRKFGFIKIFLVAFCFAFITVYILIKNNNIYFLNHKIILFQRFLIVVCLMIPFEILDSKTDDKNLQTIPQLIGNQKTKFLGFLFLTIFVSLNFHSTIDSDIATSIILAFAILFSNQNRNPYYTIFWVESIPIFWWILLLLR